MYLSRLCPHISDLGDKFEVKNSYSDTERTSFIISIMKCDKKTSKTECKNDDEISLLLDELVFTQYYL